MKSTNEFGLSYANKNFIPKIKLNDVNLFGNDAADLESEALFFSYALKRQELNDFLDGERTIQIARAYKGEGKSALLRLVKKQLDKHDYGEIVVSAIGPDHSPVVDGVDADIWTREWKKSLLKLVACEIGSRIGKAFEDDAISLVEEAEANGFKKRGFVSAIADRLKTKHLEKEKIDFDNFEKIVQRYINDRPLIWLVIDDIDQNFVNNERWKVKLAAFFTACRQIVSVIPELRIRAAVRPNVWAIIKREYESLSHLEQYMLDMDWSKVHFRQLLACRIKAYLERTRQLVYVQPNLPHDPTANELALISLIFETPMPWGGSDRTAQPHVALWTLTGHRPRWLVELCKEAGKSASARGSSKIALDDIRSNLDVFGRKRIEDTEAEFKSQCPQIGEIIGAFSRQFDIYSTDELIKSINNRVMQAVNPVFASHSGKVSALDVAHFLFQIGFIAGRRDFGENNGYDHITFKDSPELLRSRTNVDDGLRWEINPVFRQHLNLRTITNKQGAKNGGRGRPHV